MHRNIVAEDDTWPLWCFCVQHSLSTWRIVQQSSRSTRSVSSNPAASLRVFKVLPWSLQPFWMERLRLLIARSQMCSAHQMGIGAPKWWSPDYRRPVPSQPLSGRPACKFIASQVPWPTPKTSNLHNSLPSPRDWSPSNFDEQCLNSGECLKRFIHQFRMPLWNCQESLHWIFDLKAGRLPFCQLIG